MLRGVITICVARISASPLGEYSPRYFTMHVQSVCKARTTLALVEIDQSKAATALLHPENSFVRLLASITSVQQILQRTF